MDIEAFLEDTKKQVTTPAEESFRVTYRRRGSDLIFGATTDNRVQITRFNHRFKLGKHYVHSFEEINTNNAAIKEMLDKGGYKLQERKEITT